MKPKEHGAYLAYVTLTLGCKLPQPLHQSNVVEDQLNVGLKGLLPVISATLCQQEWCGLLAVDTILPSPASARAFS